MKYSATANISIHAASALGGRVYGAHHLSGIGALERKNRLLSVACYFGLSPFLWASGVIYQKNRLVNHHILYSLAFSFTILCALIINELTSWIQYWITTVIWNPTMAEFDASLVPIWIICQSMVVGSLILIAIWVYAWLVGVIGAWHGRTPQFPIISWIASRYRAIQLGMYFSLFVDILLVLIIGLAVRSVQIANTLPEKGDVYILYTQGGYIPINGLYDSFTPPGWAVTLAFYPLVRAGMEKYGDQGVAVLPLSEATFKEAIRNGQFIFVASHGGFSPGAFTISDQPYKQYLPKDIAPDQVGGQLQYVYFAGCWTGDLETEWRQVLGLEGATMFHRLSFVDEHMRWVWFNSPAVIMGLN
jgi:hypothetical protein